jgi:dienelactone hydrolase
VKRVAALLLMLGIVVGAGIGASSPADAGIPIDFPVATRDVTFVDHSRTTPAVPIAQLPGSKSRSLHTTIWYPTGSKGPFPLIVFAHGNRGTGRGYELLLSAWAAAGYVVAAPDFPVSSLDLPGIAGLTDIEQQPADVSFVITTVLALDRAKDGLGRIIDRSRIGVAGHSFGAVTTLGVAFRSCCRDKRVKAAISMSGTPLIHGTDFKGIRTPLLLIHGDADQEVGYGGSVSAFERASQPKFLLTLLGEGHFDYLLGLSTHENVALAVLHATIDFWDGFLKGDAARIAQLELDAFVPGRTTLQLTPRKG